MVVTVPRRKALPLEIERAPPQQEVQLLVRLPNRRVEPLVDDIQQPVHHACSQSRRVNVRECQGNAAFLQGQKGEEAEINGVDSEGSNSTTGACGQEQ